MDDDEFFKELDEATKDLEKEYLKNASNQNSSTKVTQPGVSSEVNQSASMNANFDPMQMNFAKLFQGFDMQNDENNINNLKNIFAGFEDNDPESQEMLKKIGQGFADLEKIVMEQKNVNPSAGFGTNTATNSNSGGVKLESNPFAEAFKDMNLGSGHSGDHFANMFKDLGGNDLKDLEGAGFLRNLYTVLGQLSKSSEGNEKMSKEELYPLFESLFDILLKEDMTTPLNNIKNSVNSYVANNKDKITPEERDKYNKINNNVDTILIELKRAEPDKKLIIDAFQNLHELSDFESDIFANNSPNDFGFGGLASLLQGNSGGSDVKDFADNFFKK